MPCLARFTPEDRFCDPRRLTLADLEARFPVKVSGDVDRITGQREQGTPVKFRDGPAAVTDVIGDLIPNRRHFTLSAIVSATRSSRSGLFLREGDSDGGIGSQKTYRAPGTR